MGSQMDNLQEANRKIDRLFARVQALEAELASRKAPALNLDALPIEQNFFKEQVAAILESMQTAVVIIAADSGRLIYVNRRAHELYGTDYVGSELTEHTLQIQALHPDGTLYAVEDLPASRSIRNGEIVQNDEIIIQQPTGKQLTVLVSSAPLYDPDGKIIAAVASFRDISERKQAELALKAALDTAEARTRELEAVVSSVPDGLAVFGPDRQMIYMNEAGHQNVSKFMTVPDAATGKSVLSAYDMTGRRILPEEEIENRIFTFGVTIQEEIFSTQPDREPVTWVAMNGAPIRNEDGTIIGAVVLSRDITERRKAERTIAMQAHLLESIHEVIIATDEKFLITYWNKPAEKLFGWTADEALGHRTSELIKPILPESTVDQAIEKILKDDVYTSESICHHKDGTAIQMENNSRLIRDADGRVREAITTIHDISDRKRAEMALRDSERKYRELVQCAPTGIYEIDIPANRFLTVNESMTELTGYSREELLAMDATTLLDEAGRERYRSRLQKLERGEISQPNADYTWTTKDGRQIHVALKVSFNLDERGRPLSMAVIAHDVTVRKQLEMALQRQAEELLAADRNKNQFLNMLSHELRNPLAVITASIDLLAHFNVDEERTHRAVRVLKRQSGHLAHLVDDLLDVTRITTGKLRLSRKPVDVIDLVRRTISDVQPQFATKGIDLSAELPDYPVVLEADPVRLTQVIGNLLDNALKFTPTDGKVSVAVTLENQSPEFIGTGSERPEAGRPEIRISVTDNGAGIGPDILPHIFEPFSQAEQPLARTHGGLGLGLAIVKGMIELHGGAVEAESDGDEKGATFTIRLPVMNQEDETT